MAADADTLMSNMSQDDIDSLVQSFAEDESAIDLTDVPDEEDDEEHIYVYDFKRPNRISKDQLRTLLSIHDSFSRIFSTTLSSILRSFIEIQIESIDQLTYSEVIMSLPNPTSLHVFEVQPMERKGFLEMNLPLAFALIDRLFGGRGRGSETSRELTKIEETVISQIIGRAFEDLHIAWSPFHPLKPILHSTESNPRFVQISLQNDIVLFLSFKVIMEESYGLISLCFPYLLLEPMLGQLSNTSWFVSNLRGQTQAERRLLSRETRHSPLPIRALVGHTDVTVEDFLALEPGDVIRLNETAGSPIQVEVGGHIRFHGKPGLLGSRVAVEISEEIIPEDLPEIVSSVAQPDPEEDS
jgi:flagellar motor switch protein FliM